ncbi:hypothetical protein HK096_007900, partial [Nowakowskiella sp. JEL0078]
QTPDYKNKSKQYIIRTLVSNMLAMWTAVGFQSSALFLASDMEYNANILNIFIRIGCMILSFQLLFTIVFIESVQEHFQDKAGQTQVANIPIIPLTAINGGINSASYLRTNLNITLENDEINSSLTLNNASVPFHTSLPIPKRKKVTYYPVEASSEGISVTFSQPSNQLGNFVDSTDNIIFNNGLFIVLQKYVPVNFDEILLEVGDIVSSKYCYDDGWCVGTNLTQKSTEGCFPLFNCQPLVDTLVPSVLLYDTSSEELLPQRSSTINSDVKSLDNLSNIIVKVIRAYKGQLADELDLAIGDCIDVLKTFDDEWALGRIINSEVVGLFPLNFCVVISQPLSESNSLFRNSTASSQGIAWLIRLPNESRKYQFSPELEGSVISSVQNSSDGVNSINAFCSRNSSITHKSSLPSILFEHLNDNGSIFKKGTKSSQWSFSDNESNRTTPLKRNSSVKSKETISELEEIDTDTYSSRKSQYEVVAVSEYFKRRNDELSLKPGNRILVLENFDDGWAYGLVLESRQIGIFPMSACKIT